MDSKKEEDRDERELVEQVKPLLIQAEKILNETQGAVKGADPDNRLSRKAQNHQQTHTATPEEQRLAAALKVVSIFDHPPLFLILHGPSDGGRSWWYD
jgi:hypothetical protein